MHTQTFECGSLILDDAITKKIYKNPKLYYILYSVTFRL